MPFSLFRDRNFSLMNWVSGAVSIGMMGIFLPFTIYLQSALGFSALKAGLTMAPASIVSMFVAPVAGRITDRIGGKYILLVGLLFFAGGMGLTSAIATTHSTWQDFVPTLALAGFGMGCTFAPMTTTAMRSVRPHDRRRGIRHDQHGPAGRRGARHGRGGRAAARTGSPSRCRPRRVPRPRCYPPPTAARSCGSSSRRRRAGRR